VDSVALTNSDVELEESGTTLATAGGQKGRSKDHITCFKCHDKGHYANAFPNDTTKDDNADAANLRIAGVENGEFNEFLFA
jgi:predicted HD phosphohydrolase